MIYKFLFLFLTLLELGCANTYPKALFPNRPECLNNGRINYTQNILFPQGDPWYDYNYEISWDRGNRRIKPDELWRKELKFLRFIQDLIENETLILSHDCQVSFWEYKINILVEDKFNKNFKEICNYTYEKTDPLTQCVNGNKIDPLCVSNYMVYRERKFGYHWPLIGNCENFLTMVQHLMLTDLRMIDTFVQDCGAVSELIGCKSLEAPDSEAGNRISSTSENFGLDCYIRKMFDDPIPDRILNRWEPQLNKCANKVMQISKVMFQKLQFDRVLYSACELNNQNQWKEKFGPKIYNNGLNAEENIFLTDILIMKEEIHVEQKCMDVLNSRISLIARNNKLFGIEQQKHIQCVNELAFYKCIPKDSFTSIFEIFSCLYDGLHNYSKNNYIASLFDERSLANSNYNEVLFKSECRLLMKYVSELFLKEPRLIPNLNIDCAQELDICYKPNVTQKDSQIVHCLMHFIWENFKDGYFNNGSKNCIFSLDKIVKVAEIGVQPKSDEKLYDACKITPNCNSLDCIQQKLPFSYDLRALHIHTEIDNSTYTYRSLFSYPKNFSDPCAQRYIEMRYFTMRNLPEDIYTGHVIKCSQKESDTPIWNAPVLDSKLSQKIIDYNGPDPSELLQPFYGINGFCSTDAHYGHNGFDYNFNLDAWMLNLCPRNNSYIQLYPLYREYTNYSIIEINNNYNRIYERQVRKTYYWGFFNNEDMVQSAKAFDKFDPTVRVKHDIIQPYYTVYYRNGTTCEETGLPRIAKIIHFCYPNNSDMYRINQPCETSPCNYEIEIYSSHLCQHPSFLPYKLPASTTPNPTFELNLLNQTYDNEFIWKRNPYNGSWKRRTETPSLKRKTTTTARPPYWYRRTTNDRWWYYNQTSKNWWARYPSTKNRQDNWYRSTWLPLEYHQSSSTYSHSYLIYFCFGIAAIGIVFAIRFYKKKNNERVLWSKTEGIRKLQLLPHKK